MISVNLISASFSGYGFKVTMTTIATLGLMFSHNTAQAQIASDGTTNTQIQNINNTALIQGGTQNGQNLFHSFKQFSLSGSEAANFDNGLDVVNIFSRVTGGAVSEIDGLIQTQGNASLFFLNPAGVIFGANAQLDVGGSLIVSTGDRFIFEDGVEFSATAPENNSGIESLLTISSPTFPVGLQYRETPGEISLLANTNRVSSNSGGLSIKPGNTLALLGGDVTITRNSLNGVKSNIEIGSVKSGSVKLDADDNGWVFNYENIPRLGNINLIDRALVVNSSGMVDLHGSSINLVAGSGIINATVLDQAKSVINLQGTESITLDNSSLLSQVWQQSANGEPQSSGAGGDIFLSAPAIQINNGSLISAATLSEFPGGNISINAEEAVTLSSNGAENPSIITTSTQGQGDGGDIAVNTARLIIKDGSQVQAFGGQGAGGTITVDANESINISGTGVLRSQNPLSGDFSEILLNSGFTASSGIEGLPPAQQPQGESGNLIINTPSLKIEKSGQISVSNFGFANAGDIQITTTNLDLDTQGKIIANTISGNGGSINIKAEKSVILGSQSAISTAARKTGAGGQINVDTGNLVLLDSDRISADAQQGSGGKVSINTQSFFADAASSVTANSENKEKTGVVEIVTLDLNSRLQTKLKEQSPLVAENYIYTGCGTGSDLVKNQFQNIGRGGIPNNLMQGNSDLETLSDLEAITSETSQSPDSQKHDNGDKNLTSKAVNQQQPIIEAEAWVINPKGKVELISPISPEKATEKGTLAQQLSGCQLSN